MKKGICPKCNSTEVYRAYAKSIFNAGITAAAGMLLLNIRNSTGGFFNAFKAYGLENYICRDCGYLEMYMPDPVKLSKLETSSNWKKVQK